MKGAIPLAVFVLALALLAPVGQTTPQVFNDFSDLTGFVLNGSAGPGLDLGHPSLRLTPSINSQAGSAFLNATVLFADDYSFSTSFAFRIHDHTFAPADGMTFVIQNDPRGPAALGGAGGGLGYYSGTSGSITPSLAVSFDTYPGSLVGIHTNGDLVPIAAAPPGAPLENEILKYCWIDYDGTTDILKVYLAELDVKPALPLLGSPIDLATVFGAERNLYVGFTAATGGAASTHDVREWTFETAGAVIPEPATLTLLACALLSMATAPRRRRS